MTSIEKIYNPKEIETKWYETWEKNAYFSPKGEGPAYCIMLPPPNVTGSLHMGHGFGFTLMDVLIRYHRMKGDNTLWQAGVDHAGIATQMVVEKQLNALGQTRHDLGREQFVEKIWTWKEESGSNITRQSRRMGASLDWQRERFTLDEELSYAVREVFIRLFEEGLIYRGEKLVNWDPMLLSAISDLEVISEEANGEIWYIRYPLVDGSGHMVVATTRPETLLGDAAVAIHPEDERYKAFLGKKVKLPLTDRLIPVIADEYVDPLFGTGCVKITPAHDFNDYQVGLRHHLPMINIFTQTAHLNENVPAIYQGLERFKARKLVLEHLKENNLLEKTEPHTLKIPRGEKSGVVIEPFLTKQWFMQMKPLALPAIEAVEKGEIRFIPENWSKTYFQWMNNIEDWCISRQLWWGHRIPVWYDNDGNAYVGQDENDVRKRNHLADDMALKQDEDVLDTWFSSALWPFSTLGWPKETKDLSTFFPTNVLVTGFDIIFFWVARMIMLSLKFTKQIPFKEVYITGLIRDAEGHKMSKSKGNVLDPIDLIDGISLDELINKRTASLMLPSMKNKIEKNTKKEFPEGIASYGTDALRFTFCSVASYTREIRFDTNRLAGYRNFCNKLWNATRYVLMNSEDYETYADENKEFTVADKWIISLLNKTIAEATEALSQYRFDHFAQILYDFTWNEFCDWYLELSKPVLIIEKDKGKLAGTKHTLINVLETLLRLLHPIMPFITEELWQRLSPLSECKAQSIMIAPYPEYNASNISETAMHEVDWLKKIIVAIRTIRSEMNISPAKSIPILLRKGIEKDVQYIELHQNLLKHLAKIDDISWLNSTENPPPSASAFIGELEIYIPMATFINKEEETKRLQKEIGKIQKDLNGIDQKLNNESFVDKAPKEVVAKERVRFKDLQQTLMKLEKQVTEIQNL